MEWYSYFFLHEKNSADNNIWWDSKKVLSTYYLEEMKHKYTNLLQEREAA